jgi:predicted HicB family RNase H-like nuclease
VNYKGYIGMPVVDHEAGVIRGRVINTRDMITFQGKTVEEAKQAFEESVDDYLEFCASRNEKPERPYSGKFMVRISPATHQALAVDAAKRGLSLNELVSRALTGTAKKMAVKPGIKTTTVVRKAKANAKTKPAKPAHR